MRSPAARHPGDRGLRGDRLGGELGGHRALRPQQAGLAGDLPGPAERHPLARHLPPGLHAARPGRVRGLLRDVGAVAGGRGRARGGRGRRQDRPALGQPPPRVTARCTWSAPGRARQRAGARPARGRRQVERDHRHPGAARCPAARRLHRDARRDGLPEGDRRADPGQGRRLSPGLKANHGRAFEAVREHFERTCFGLGSGGRPVFDAFDEGHGRLVRRRVFAGPGGEGVSSPCAAGPS